MGNILDKKCPFCGKTIPFGDRCRCLETAKGREEVFEYTKMQINRLYTETMALLERNN